MKFEKCNPYVRYCEIIKNNIDEPGTFKKSYDNCMIYMLSGNADVCVEDDKYSLNHGDILTWRAGMAYSIELSDSKSSYMHINFDYTERKRTAFNFKIEPDLCDAFDADKITDVITFDDLLGFNHCVYSPNKNILEEIFLGLHSDFKVKRNCLNMRLKARISLILCEISNEFFYSSHKKSPNLINEILAYIEDNCTNIELTNESISKKFGFHPRHINRLVSQKTGYSLHKYLIIKRIQKAAALLIQTKVPIALVGARVGFNNVYHFSRYFKQIMGLSPMKYRQQNQNEYGL